MGVETAISWADHTFNPWIGCTKVGPACDGCYAEALMSTDGRMKRVTWGKPGQRATHVRTSEANWRQPLSWNRAQAVRLDEWQAAVRQGLATPDDRPRTPFVFCASLADVFDKDADPAWRRDLFDLIRATPNLTWLLLTKRPQNIVGLYRHAMGLSHPDRADPRSFDVEWPKNAAIGCTVVTQAEADRDVPHLLAAKAALNPAFAFVSMEPLLGATDIAWAISADRLERAGGFMRRGMFSPGLELDTRLDWVIAGGETDQGAHKARPSHPGWFQFLRDQCALAGVPFHFKQWGEWTPGDNLGPATGPQIGAYVDADGSWEETRFTKADIDNLTCDTEPSVWRAGKKVAGRLLDGVTHDARPITP